MQIRRLLLTTAAALTLTLTAAGTGSKVAAQSAAVLSGQVSSADESAMEGVVVSAKKAGGTITVSVISDAQGHFNFPSGRLEPGSYALRIRAAGYELDGPKAVDVGPQGAPITIKAAQGQERGGPAHQRRVAHEHPRATSDQKNMLDRCTSCHTLERSDQVDLRRGRADRSAPAHGRLCAWDHAARAAQAARRAQHGRAHRPAAAARGIQSPASI